MLHFNVIVCHHLSTPLYIRKHWKMSLYFYESKKTMLYGERIKKSKILLKSSQCKLQKQLVEYFHFRQKLQIIFLLLSKLQCDNKLFIFSAKKIPSKKIMSLQRKSEMELFQNRNCRPYLCRAISNSNCCNVKRKYSYEMFSSFFYYE